MTELKKSVNAELRKKTLLNAEIVAENAPGNSVSDIAKTSVKTKSDEVFDEFEEQVEDGYEAVAYQSTQEQLAQRQRYQAIANGNYLSFEEEEEEEEIDFGANDLLDKFEQSANEAMDELTFDDSVLYSDALNNTLNPGLSDAQMDEALGLGLKSEIPSIPTEGWELNDSYITSIPKEGWEANDVTGNANENTSNLAIDGGLSVKGGFTRSFKNDNFCAPYDNETSLSINASVSMSPRTKHNFEISLKPKELLTKRLKNVIETEIGGDTISTFNFNGEGSVSSSIPSLKGAGLSIQLGNDPKTGLPSGELTASYQLTNYKMNTANGEISVTGTLSTSFKYIARPLKGYCLVAVPMAQGFHQGSQYAPKVIVPAAVGTLSATAIIYSGGSLTGPAAKAFYTSMAFGGLTYSTATSANTTIYKRPETNFYTNYDRSLTVTFNGRGIYK